MSNLSKKIVVIDIGSSRVASLVFGVDKNGILHFYKYIIMSMVGFVAGNIKNMEAATKNIENLIYQIEKEAKIAINEVIVTFSGGAAVSGYVQLHKKIKQPPITRSNVDSLINSGLQKLYSDKRDIIYFNPIEFVVGDNHHIQNPVGMMAKEVGVSIHGISASTDTMLNIKSLLQKLNIGVSEFLPNSFLASFAVTSNAEKEKGVIVIELGASTTTLSLISSGSMIYTTYVPIGGWNITKDISTVVEIDMEVAEKLKILHCDLSYNYLNHPDSIITAEEIGLKQFGRNSGSVKKSILQQIVNARVEETVTILQEKFNELQLDHLVHMGIVLTGGGSELKGIQKIISKIFDKKVRIAEFATKYSIPEGVSPNIISPLIGLVLYKQQLMQSRSDLFLAEQEGPFKRIVKWIKTNL